MNLQDNSDISLNILADWLYDANKAEESNIVRADIDKVLETHWTSNMEEQWSVRSPGVSRRFNSVGCTFWNAVGIPCNDVGSDSILAHSVGSMNPCDCL